MISAFGSHLQVHDRYAVVVSLARMNKVERMMNWPPCIW